MSEKPRTLPKGTYVAVHELTQRVAPGADEFVIVAAEGAVVPADVLAASGVWLLEAGHIARQEATQ